VFKRSSFRRLLIALLPFFVGALTAGAAGPDELAQRIKDFTKQAVQGDGPSQLKLALAFDEAGNSKMAALWYEMSARRGYIEAASRLGVKCLRGDGVPQDHIKAVSWFRLAAERGDTTAQFLLAGCYAGGVGVPKNLVQAADWCRQAAERGLPEAEYMLGALYGRGEGVSQDYVKSFQWVSKAAAQGYPQAKQSLETLKRVMTSEQLARAETLAHDLNVRISPARSSSSSRRSD
jgi:TPR repeat protein